MALFSRGGRPGGVGGVGLCGGCHSDYDGGWDGGRGCGQGGCGVRGCCGGRVRTEETVGVAEVGGNRGWQSVNSYVFLYSRHEIWPRKYFETISEVFFHAR